MLAITATLTASLSIIQMTNPLLLYIASNVQWKVCLAVIMAKTALSKVTREL